MIISLNFLNDLKDFEALTPNLLARTVETVEGGGLVILLLRTMTSLKQLYTMTMASSILLYIILHLFIFMPTLHVPLSIIYLRFVTQLSWSLSFFLINHLKNVILHSSFLNIHSLLPLFLITSVCTFVSQATLKVGFIG